MREITADCGSVQVIGIRHENGRTVARIPLGAIADIVAEYPGGSYTLGYRRRLDNQYWVCSDFVVEGDELIWTVGSHALGVAGDVIAQVSYSDGTVIAQTPRFRFSVGKSLFDGEEGQGENLSDLVEQAITAVGQVDGKIAEAEAEMDAAVAEKIDGALGGLESRFQERIDEAIEEIGEHIDLSGKADKADTVLDTTLSRGRAEETAAGAGSIAFGNGVTASGEYSQGLGGGMATGDYSHAVNMGGAQGDYSHAEGGSTAEGEYSHAEGYGGGAVGLASHSEGTSCRANGENSHAEGNGTQANFADSHAEGYGTVANNYRAHAEGENTTARGKDSHAEGKQSVASGDNSHAEGTSTTASKRSSHAEGNSTTASANQAHAEGDGTTASGTDSHAEGGATKATAMNSHAEGGQTEANGANSHAEGGAGIANGANSHVEGWQCQTTVQAGNAHAEGASTTASGANSHAEGASTTASGANSHAEGTGTVAYGPSQHAMGQYNQSHDPVSAEIAAWEAGKSYDYGDVMCLSGIVYGCKIPNSDTTFIAGNWTSMGNSKVAFMIGNGVSNDIRHTGFAVLWDGSVMIGDTQLTEEKLKALIAEAGQRYVIHAELNAAGTELTLTVDRTFAEVLAAISAQKTPVMYVTDRTVEPATTTQSHYAGIIVTDGTVEAIQFATVPMSPAHGEEYVQFVQMNNTGNNTMFVDTVHVDRTHDVIE